jgi:hypothetical protein
MTKTIEGLEAIIPRYSKLLRAVPVTEMDAKPSPGKWSKKEQVGHLIDSAQNNIRRFLEAQYQSEPPTIVYNQDEWVTLNNYQSWPLDELIDLWVLLNRQIVSILQTMPADNYNKLCYRREQHTILWLAEDYNKHLLYHLHRILDLEPLPYP